MPADVQYEGKPQPLICGEDEKKSKSLPMIYHPEVNENGKTNSEHQKTIINFKEGLNDDQYFINNGKQIKKKPYLEDSKPFDPYYAH